MDFVAGCGFVELESYSGEAHDTSGGDESAGVERAGRDFAAGVYAASGFGDGAVDHPAHDASAEHGERSADGEIGSDGEGERTHTENFNGDDKEDAEEDESPGKLACEDAVDDGGHEAALWGCCFLAADALYPLDFDVASLRVVEIFAVGERGGAECVEQHVLTAFDEFLRVVRLCELEA